MDPSYSKTYQKRYYTAFYSNWFKSCIFHAAGWRPFYNFSKWLLCWWVQLPAKFGTFPRIFTIVMLICLTNLQLQNRVHFSPFALQLCLLLEHRFSLQRPHLICVDQREPEECLEVQSQGKALHCPPNGINPDQSGAKQGGGGGESILKQTKKKR